MSLEVLAGRDCEITIQVDAVDKAQHKWARVEINWQTPQIPVPGFGDTDVASIVGLPVVGGRLTGWLQRGDADANPAVLNGQTATLTINWYAPGGTSTVLTYTLTVLLGSIALVADAEGASSISMDFVKKANTTATYNWA